MRTILLSDANSFYANVEILYRPELSGKPVAVCGSVENRHGIVLAANQIAKKFGIKTAEVVWQAKQKCRDLVIVEPHMDRYVKFSKAAQEIYSDFTPTYEQFGLDESYLDLTGTEGLFGSGENAANQIRQRVKDELGITVSIGVSFNKVFAKLASELRKPDYTNVISTENFKEIVWPRPVSELYYVGRATSANLNSVGISTIGQLANAPPDFLKRRLGINGLTLHRYANGLDNSPVTQGGSMREIKSIGNSTTAKRDLETVDEIRITTMLLAESVAERMRSKDLKCKTVQVSLRYTDLTWFERQIGLPFPSCTAQRIADVATKLILKNWTGVPLRGIGVRGCNLISDEYPQLSFLPEMKTEQKQEDLEKTMQGLRKRFGHFCIERGIMVADRNLSDLDTQDEASSQTIAFFRG